MSLSSSFDLDDLDRLTVGTVGPPGQRTFYLQATTATQIVSLKLEKTQVAALATYLTTLVADLPAAGPLPTTMDLLEPVVPEWVIGAMGATYDESADRVLIRVEELPESEGDTSATARFRATREQIAALAAHGAALVAAGRPTCQLCGQPINADGHACVRMNGHGRPSR